MPGSWGEFFLTLVALFTGGAVPIFMLLAGAMSAMRQQDVDLTNFTQEPVAFSLEHELDADFADLSETKGNRQ